MTKEPWKNALLRGLFGEPEAGRGRRHGKIPARKVALIPLEDLPEAIRARVEHVRAACAEQIGAYREVSDKMGVAELAYQATWKHPLRFIGDDEGWQKAEEARRNAWAAREAAITSAQPVIRATWHAIEQQLIKEFAPELCALCKNTNPVAYYEETQHLASDKEKQAHVIGLLQHTEPPPLPSYLDIQPPHTNDVPIHPADGASSAPQDAHVHSGLNANRLRQFEDARALQEMLRPKHLSLSDTVNGLWTESIHGRITVQPDDYALPHMYSIMNHLLSPELQAAKAQTPPSGWKKRITDTPPDDPSKQRS
jgi:hypothetical protein